MMNTANTLIGGAFIGLIGMVVTSPFAVGPNQVRHLTVDVLEYIEVDGVGAVRQRIASKGGNIVPAKWVATLERQRTGGTMHILCTGSDQGQYNGETTVWNLNDWTQDACIGPDGQAITAADTGDFFEVSWTFDDENGWPVSIGDRFVLNQDKQLERVTR